VLLSVPEAGDTTILRLMYLSALLDSKICQAQCEAACLHSATDSQQSKRKSPAHFRAGQLSLSTAVVRATRTVMVTGRSGLVLSDIACGGV
jgi:hypothetical protein